MVAERAPNHADGTVCTDKAFRVRQVGEDKPEEKQTSGTQHFWILGVVPKLNLAKYKLFQISKRILGYIDKVRDVLRSRNLSTLWYLEWANCP